MTPRQAVRRPSPQIRITVVDRNFIDADTLAWQLEDRRNRIIWVRRGLVTQSQALAQSGFLAFADLVIALGDVGGDFGDPVCDLANRQGKLRMIGICHAYQVVRPSAGLRQQSVFMSLGSFEEPFRQIHGRIRSALAAAEIPVLWSAYNDLPTEHGFSPTTRVTLSDALRVKSDCVGLVSEGGYNSLHEAMFLSRPALLIANDSNGREQQSVRIRAAKRLSPNVFDASAHGEPQEWLAAVRASFTSPEKERVPHDFAGSGFVQMARIVEEYCLVHTH